MFKKTKGYSSGGKVKSKGMKNGGVMKSKGYKAGGKVGGKPKNKIIFDINSPGGPKPKGPKPKGPRSKKVLFDAKPQESKVRKKPGR